MQYKCFGVKVRYQHLPLRWRLRLWSCNVFGRIHTNTSTIWSLATYSRSCLRACQLYPSNYSNSTGFKKKLPLNFITKLFKLMIVREFLFQNTTSLLFSNWTSKKADSKNVHVLWSFNFVYWQFWKKIPYQNWRYFFCIFCILSLIPY